LVWGGKELTRLLDKKRNIKKRQSGASQLQRIGGSGKWKDMGEGGKKWGHGWQKQKKRTGIR